MGCLDDITPLKLAVPSLPLYSTLLHSTRRITRLVLDDPIKPRFQGTYSGMSGTHALVVACLLSSHAMLYSVLSIPLLLCSCAWRHVEDA